MKDKLLQIRVDEGFLSKLSYLQKVNGYKSIAETVRKIVEKEYRKKTEPWTTFSKLEHLTLDNVYIGETKLTDLIQSGRLMSVGFCNECGHHLPPLTGVIDGEVKELTSMRCPLMSSGFTRPNGWCYHFRQGETT